MADWQVIGGDDEFFSVTKAMHNALQGADTAPDSGQRRTYLENAERNAAELAGQQYDFGFVHDPQPAALLSLLGKDEGRWIWRCRIDTSAPSPEAWAFLRGFLAGYDAAIFTLAEFLAPDLPVERVELIPPANRAAEPEEPGAPGGRRAPGARMDRRAPRPPAAVPGVALRPLEGAAGCDRRLPAGARGAPRGSTLALAGSMALDDPEGFEIYREIVSEAEADPRIHAFTNLTGVGNIEVNAFQRLSDIVVQKSIREGFGLVVSEALWKGTPVVAGRAGGIPLQMADCAGGFLVDGVEECAQAILRLLRDPGEAAALASRGRARTREHFLLPRRSEACRARFEVDPARYAAAAPAGRAVSAPRQTTGHPTPRIQRSDLDRFQRGILGRLLTRILPVRESAAPGAGEAAGKRCGGTQDSSGPGR